jgi:bacteriocin biosynthesis cyclodehydratase domain-containing protein
MSRLKYLRPRLPSHYYVLSEPPDAKGEEILCFVSERRRIKLKGHSFREFHQYVVPLLDGRHSLDEIEAEVADMFRTEDLEAGLQLLADQNLLEDAAEAPVPPDTAAAIQPQLNFFHEVSANARQAQEKLLHATVSVLGLAGAGASVALALAAVRVGTVRCIDSLSVAPTDPYLSPALSLSDVGRPRAEAVAQRIHSTAPEVRAIAHATPLESDTDVVGAVIGSDFVVCCVDPGQSALAYKLNRVCLQEKIVWTSCSATGMEVIIGPTVHPFETACYLCYKMRAVACAEWPEDDFSFQRMLDRRKRDDSGRRENLTFATGIAANFLGLEVLKYLSGIVPGSTTGRIAVINLVDLAMTKHVVLRKPWCPACFPNL